MNTYLLSSLVALSVAGVVVPATAMPDADGENAVERLMAQFEQSVDQAVNEVRSIPVVASQAYGHTENGTITHVSVTVRAVGDVDLGFLVLLQGPVPTAWSIEAIRDADESVASGRLNEGDLVTFGLDLELPRGGDVAIGLDLPGHRGHEWALDAPRNLSPSLVDLDLRVLH